LNWGYEDSEDWEYEESEDWDMRTGIISRLKLTNLRSSCRIEGNHKIIINRNARIRNHIKQKRENKKSY
jgi:hypothetical protein